MGAGAPSTEGDGQLVPPDKRPDAAPMLHARGAPLASARVPSARLAALLALAVTASAQGVAPEWTQAKKDAIDVGCAVFSPGYGCAVEERAGSAAAAAGKAAVPD